MVGWQFPFGVFFPAHRARTDAASLLCQYVAVGVGQARDDEEPVAEVRGADGSSGDTVPPRIIPERGKVPEHNGEPVADEGGDVLDDDPLRPPFADEASVLAPEPRALAIEAATASKAADILAGKTAAVELRAAEVGCADLLDI